MKAVIITCLLFLVTTSQVWADSPTEVNICHWQDYNGFWKLIVVNARAVETHMTIHDDSLPGGVTNFTGIELDENCAEVASLPSCGTCLEYGSPGDPPGCSNTECQDLVVEKKATVGAWFCDTYYWDSLCVGWAQELCEGIVCE